MINSLGDSLSEHREQLYDASSTRIISAAERYQSEIDDSTLKGMDYDTCINLLEANV